MRRRNRLTAAAAAAIATAGTDNDARLPQTKRHRLPWRPVESDGPDRHTDQGTGLGFRVGHRGTGEDEGGRGSIERCYPPQSAHQCRQMRSEHPSVDVTFVDHDVVQRPKERSPSLVTGKQRVMYEVGVGQDVLAVVADPAAFIRWGVTVVGCGPKAGDGQSREAS